MIRSVLPNVSLPDYIFRYEFDHFYVFEVDIISCTEDFFSCLKNFLSQIGESTFSVKNKGPFHLEKGNASPEVYFPVYEHDFSTSASIKEIEKRLTLFYYYGDNKHGQDYLQIAWDGVIEGGSDKWALHFERPTDIALFGIQLNCQSAFEDAFLSNPTMRELYIEDLRDIQSWAMRDERLFQEFLKNYKLDCSS